MLQEDSSCLYNGLTYTSVYYHDSLGNQNHNLKNTALI